MIRHMESENVKVELFAADDQTPVVPVVRLTIKGVEIELSVDELNELNRITENSWSVNRLYDYTREAIAERQRWEGDRNNVGLSQTNGAITGNIGRKLPQLAQ